MAHPSCRMMHRQEAAAIYNDAMIDERVKRHGGELVVLRKRLSPDRMTDRL
ncbi:MAG TPA: hypothetical protein VMX15_05020 [Candidatus Heimdallarchaeota archaeon]|nr:hypothetical protein [Candidatus Heimdallarchaeota archaeon]